MSTKAAYTSDEWSLVRTTPTFVSAGVAAADPGGIFSAITEASAGISAFSEFITAHLDSEFFKALVEDKSLPAMPDPSTLLGSGDSAQQSVNFQHAVIERARAALAVIRAKGTAEEAAAYRDLLNSVAARVANASTEGGFLGFGGVRVSEHEHSFLAALATALDAPESAAAAVTPLS